LEFTTTSHNRKYPRIAPELPYIASNGKINIIPLPHQKTRYKPNKRITGNHARIDPEHAETFGRNQTQTQHENTTDGTTDGNRHEKNQSDGIRPFRAADTKKILF
jgi:hypothetical protein